MKTNNFEEKIEKLEKVVNELENGEMNLDESLVKFEESFSIKNNP